MKNKSSKQANIFVSEEEKTINWPDLLSEFRKNFGDEIYNSWLKNVSLVKEYNDYNSRCSNKILQRLDCV